MNSLAINGMTILAQIDKWQEMGRDFRTDRPKFDPTILVACFCILFAIFCGIWFLSRIMARQEGRRLFNSPKQLFRALCREHELSRSECRLLVRIARAENIPLPASLFLQPEFFEIAARRSEFVGQMPLLRQLRGRLFDGLPTVPISSVVAVSQLTALDSAAAASGGLI